MQLHDGGADTNQNLRMTVFDRFTQRRIFGDQSAAFKGVAHGDAKTLRVKGFRDKVDGAQFHRLNHHVERGIATHHNDLGVS